MPELKPEQYTKFERARILGARALQISANAPILIKLSKEQLESLNYDPIKIAELEFQAGILPITVKRPLPKKIEKKLPEVIEIVKEEKTKEKKALKEEPIATGEAKVEEEAEKEAEEAEKEESEEDIADEFEKAETTEE